MDTGEGTFIGYASKLLAAENNSSTEGTANRTISQAISGAKLFALNLNQGSTVARNNTLSTAFDGNEESGQNFFNNGGNVIEINGSDGVIDSVTDATPPTPTLNASTVSTASDDITIRVNVDATVIRSFTVRVTPSGGSTTTQSVNASSQNSSLQQDISLKTIGFSLSSGTAHTIDVRADNEAESSGFSTQRTFSTDAAATNVSGPADYSQTEIDGSTSDSPLKQFTITNPSGNSTVTFAKVSGTTQFNVKFAALTTGTPSSFVNSGNTITLSQSGNVNVITQFEGRSQIAGQSGVYRLTVTNNSASDSVDVTLTTFDEGDGGFP